MNTTWIACVPALLVSAGLVVLTGCHAAQGGSTVSTPQRSTASDDTIDQVPLGDLAGAAFDTLGSTIKNPFGDDPQAVQQGKELFIKMNCAGCHGYGATGGMGPNLTDQYWRYGGVPVDIYKSIHDGRPQGMPAWDRALPTQEIWKIVAYIQSLGGSFTAADYQAAIQGDRAGEMVSPEESVAGHRPAPERTKEKNGTGPANAGARPDAGGDVPGSKP